MQCADFACAETNAGFFFPFRKAVQAIDCAVGAGCSRQTAEGCLTSISRYVIFPRCPESEWYDALFERCARRILLPEIFALHWLSADCHAQDCLQRPTPIFLFFVFMTI